LLLILLNKETHYGKKFFPREWENLLTCDYPIKIGSLLINAVLTVAEKRLLDQQTIAHYKWWLHNHLTGSNKSLVKSLCLCTQPSNRWLYFSAPNSTANYVPAGWYFTSIILAINFPANTPPEMIYKNYDKFYILHFEKNLFL